MGWRSTLAVSTALMLATTAAWAEETPPPIEAPPPAAPVPTPGYTAPPPGYALPPPGPPPVAHRTSTSTMVVGIVLISAGAVGAAVGAALVARPLPCVAYYLPSGNCAYYSGADRELGIGLLVAGIAGIGLGIPLTVIGARRARVPATPQDPRASAPPAGEPTLRLGLGHAALSMTL